MMRRRNAVVLVLVLFAAGSAAAAGAAAAEPSEPCEIGSQRELFVDRWLIDRLDGARLEIGRPQPAGTAIRYDKPWEGIFAFYTTIVRDGDVFRMYYRGESPGTQRAPVCYAESKDGIHWMKPELGLVEIDGSKANNVLMLHTHCFSPFLDPRPECPAEERWKGNLEVSKGLVGYVSADGIHWKALGEQILVPRVFENNFDSQNVMFWSPAEKKYLCYSRHMVGGSAPTRAPRPTTSARGRRRCR